MGIDRDEFDRLVARVDRLEVGQHATIDLVASELVGLRTHVDEGFARLDRRIDLYTGQVAIAIQVGSEAVAENRRANDVIDGRLGAMDDRLDGIDGRLDGMDARFDGIDGRLDGIDARFDVMFEHFGIEVPEG